MPGSIKEFLVRPIINIIPFGWLKYSADEALVIGYYHVVSDQNLPHVTSLYKYKSTEGFTKDLDFLLKEYQFITLAEAIQWVKGNANLPKNALLLTFDDGFREVHDIIAPMLLQKGIPATVFVTTAFIDNAAMCFEQKASLLVDKFAKGVTPAVKQAIQSIFRQAGVNSDDLARGVLSIKQAQQVHLDEIAKLIEISFAEYLSTVQPYLTSNQIKALIKDGFSIGGHSIDHPYYCELNSDQQLVQTLACVLKLKAEFALSYGAFAFPHNDTGVSQEFYETVISSELVDIIFGTGGMLPTKHAFHKQRVSLEKPVLPAKELLAWQYARKLLRA